MGDTCSICGNAPALCVDPDDKGTYFLCHSCAVENVMSGILLQAFLQQRVEALEKWQAAAFEVEPNIDLGVARVLAAAQDKEQDDD